MSQLVLYTADELAALRREWKAGAARIQYGSCQGPCGRVRTDDDRPVLVVRQERCRRFLCLHCWIAARPRRRKGRP